MRKIITILFVASIVIGVVWSVNYYFADFGKYAGWQTFNNNDQGFSFKYPDLVTKYIRPQEWPPTMEIEKDSFSCANVGSEMTINGRVYCAVINSEGAAGSIYNSYRYTFEKNQKFVTLSFVMRFVQCVNYSDPEKQACDFEQSSFDLDRIVDGIVSSFRFIK